MTFAEAVKTCFARFFVIFKGRSRRSEYWFTTLLYCIMILALVAVVFLDVFLTAEWGESRAGEWKGALFFLLVLASFAAQLIAIPLFPTTWRRLHDVGKPGWLLIIDFPLTLALSCSLMLAERESTVYYTLGIISAVFWILDLIYRIYILVLLCRDGNPYTNKYGPDPKGRGLDRQMALTEASAVAEAGQNAEEEAASPYDFGAGAVPGVEAPEGKAKKDKGYLSLAIVLAILVVLLMGLLFANFYSGIAHKAKAEEVSESNASLLAENEALQEEIAALEQDAAHYDSLQQHLHTNPLKPSFYPSEYVFVMSPGETESFTLYCLYNTAATIYTDQYGEAAEFAFTEDEWEWSTEIALTANEPGSTEIYFSNTANNEVFSIIVLVLEEY